MHRVNYPNINDKKFYADIDKIYAKYKIPKKKKSMKEICFPKKYELQMPQVFLSEFINPKTPYKGVLVYHRIGSGKTCTAIQIAEKFVKSKNVIVVLPASLKNNFRAELRTGCVGNKYITENERKLLRKYDPSSVEYKNIIAKTDERIDSNYRILSYNKFIKLVTENQINLENSLLIIDEIHNMISETGIYYKVLHDLLHNAPDSLRTVLLTATPIFDKPIEIALTLNLFLKDNKIPVGNKFVETFMNIRYTKNRPIYEVKNMDLLKDYARGYVSYYRGAPPYTFPKTEIKLVSVKMSDYQQKIYKKILTQEFSTTTLDDYVNVNVSNSFLIGTRMASNIVFPNGRNGLNGFNSMTSKDYIPSNFKQFSPKIVKIYRKINACKGTVFVYSSFKEYGGIKSVADFLKHNGYKDYETYGPGKKRYAIWSGDQDNIVKDEIKNVFNNIDNKDGSKIKVILGSPSIKEGVSLLRVKEVHVMEPYWNYSRMDQVIGRAVRFCSHKDVPEDEQIVKIYIYIAVHPTFKRSVDKHIMRMAINKNIVKNIFEQALKESAVDCTLFKNANVYPGEQNIVCAN